MKLQGFRCDFCGTESVSPNAARSWIEVRSLRINQDGWSSLGVSDGLHYCRRVCLLAAIEQQWEMERP